MNQPAKFGYFEIGIHYVKNQQNLGTLWRSAYQLGAAGIFTVGKKYSKQSSDTNKCPLKIPYRSYHDTEDFFNNRPVGSRIIGIEMGGVPLSEFEHPDQCIYLLGSEDNGLPPDVIRKCNDVISLDHIRTGSYNVAVAGSLVMYHRMFGEKNL